VILRVTNPLITSLPNHLIRSKGWPGHHRCAGLLHYMSIIIIQIIIVIQAQYCYVGPSLLCMIIIVTQVHRCYTGPSLLCISIIVLQDHHLLCRSTSPCTESRSHWGEPLLWNSRGWTPGFGECVDRLSTWAKLFPSKQNVSLKPGNGLLQFSFLFP
jgi:hypothetical protein